ncbi:MAG: Holliday junction branch migration protein RuvA [Bacteroidales bacterium]|jgi:Holliday junction DNA helicase RuvA|nr:Holliday junction branch migration protein RuvA [Bacteroidales bacterium]
MFDFIKGKISELKPTYTIIENQGIGYHINISINSYSLLQNKTECLLYIHEVIREDIHQLYGFVERIEREIFEQLISVSGVGANTARVMLSSLSPNEIKSAILNNDVNTIKSVKGIGLKTAQRIIVDLRDKIGKISGNEEIPTETNNTIREEALSALLMLGFPKTKVEKVINSILKQEQGAELEDLIKLSLKRL